MDRTCPARTHLSRLGFDRFCPIYRRTEEDANDQVPTASLHLRRALLHRCPCCCQELWVSSSGVPSPLRTAVQRTASRTQRADSCQPVCSVPGADSRRWRSMVSAMGYNGRCYLDSNLGNVTSNHGNAGEGHDRTMDLGLDQDLSHLIPGWALWRCCRGHMGP